MGNIYFFCISVDLGLIKFMLRASINLLFLFLSEKETKGGVLCPVAFRILVFSKSDEPSFKLFHTSGEFGDKKFVD